MLQSLRYNNGMRRHQSAFEKGAESRFLGKDPNSMDDDREAIDIEEDPTANWDEAKKERVAKIVAERRREVELERESKHLRTRTTIVISTLSVFLLLLFSAYYAFNTLKKDSEDSERNLRLIQEQEKNAEQALYMMQDAEIYERKGEKEEALMRYNEVLKLLPGNGKAQQAIARLNQQLSIDSLNQNGIRGNTIVGD
ncbi:MAG: hypothetical protein EP332_13350 [Bacteroidetes bacterium]|nr:MAG: hypothetical protein EP332_13350 [Bacteroidota bacterium]